MAGRPPEVSYGTAFRLPVMNAATPGGTSPEPDLLDAGQLSGDPELAAGFAVAAHRILAELVRGGAPLGWTDPPPADEVAELVGRWTSTGRSAFASTAASPTSSPWADAATTRSSTCWTSAEAGSRDGRSGKHRTGSSGFVTKRRGDRLRENPLRPTP